MDHVETLRLLGAVEYPAGLTPRDRLELGLLPSPTHEGDRKGIDRLHAGAVASLASTESHETIKFGIKCLLALGELCKEIECSERLGLIGGHQDVLRLMTEGCVARGTTRCTKQENFHLNSSSTERRDSGEIDATPAAARETTTVASRDVEEQDEEEDEVQCAAALVAASVVSSGCSFPMRPSFLCGDESSGMGRFPLQYDFVIAGDSGPPKICTRTDNDSTEATAVHVHDIHQCDGSASVGTTAMAVVNKPGGGRPWQSAVPDATASVRGNRGSDFSDGERVSILVRPVKERQHSQFDVGFVMWPAAVILSRLLCRHPEIVRGRRVLEIGAGLGLAGLVAARVQQQNVPAMPRYRLNKQAMAEESSVGSVRPASSAAGSVTLSDFNPLVLKALKSNVALNASRPQGGSLSREDTCGDSGSVCESADGSRQRWSKTHCEEGSEDRESVCVRHLDWDKLESTSGTRRCRRDGLGHENGSATQKQFASTGGGGSNSGGCVEDAIDSRPPFGSNANRHQREEVRGVDHGEHFDVIIASDHICQASDAEGTIRVLQTMLAEGTPESALAPPGRGGEGGEAHFVVAHPRTRWGVDALVPLLEQCPGLSFTCEEVSDPDLVEGLEEASYLAWLYVHVWRRRPSATAAGGMGFDQDGDEAGEMEIAEPPSEAILVVG